MIPANRDSYGPPLGARVDEVGTHFALWTSRASECIVRIFSDGQGPRDVAMSTEGNGVYTATVPGVGHGARYTFVLDGEELRDPYATFLPDGVDAPAMVWRSDYAWQHEGVARPLAEHVIYELHVGTFTTEGTYAAAAARLPALVELGISAIELMPVGAFPGTRGWGYDVVAHYAAFAPYGTPDELRAFIDRAHGLGLAVFLDVVYNHFGPAGNVLPRYGSEYFTSKHRTPWGDAPNFELAPMRKYVVDNVRYWLETLRFDGLRFDAVHEIVDESPRHILTELADLATSLSPQRIVIAEDDRNDPAIIERHGFHGVWADDFHHQVRVALTGERDGYYAAYTGAAADLADTITSGWFYRGAAYPLTGKARGKDARQLAAAAFVYCIQNHDQIGNRAFGDRFTSGASPEVFAAAAMLLLFLPMTPLLFMGQEWAASAPFLFFTDHAAELGKLVTEGRRKEFARFASFADPNTRERIPDPQHATTFERSRLDWNERQTGEHGQVLAIHRAMLHLRRTDAVLKHASREDLRARADGDVLVVERSRGDDVRLLAMNLGDGPAALALEQRTAPKLLLASHAGVREHTPLPRGAAVLVAHRRI